MNWLTNFVKPRIAAMLNKKEVPDNLWISCPSCTTMLHHSDLDANLHVCKNCGYHLRIDPEKRLQYLYDGGVYTVEATPKTIIDPLKFRDQKKYADRLVDAQKKTGAQDALVIANGMIGGHKVVTACFDFRFMGGSMGTAVGEGIVAAAELAVRTRSAMLAIPASGGARMQEGILSLMQMPRSIIAVDRVKHAGLPYLVLLTDPTTGGVTASFAMVGDIHLAEPGAEIAFAGKRVIQGTIRETLPENFQTSEYLREHGMVDIVVKRSELNGTIGRILGLLQGELPKTQGLISKMMARAN